MYVKNVYLLRASLKSYGVCDYIGLDIDALIRVTANAGITFKKLLFNSAEYKPLQNKGNFYNSLLLSCV